MIWISLGILWLAIVANVVAIVMNIRVRKRMKQLVAEMEKTLGQIDNFQRQKEKAHLS